MPIDNSAALIPHWAIAIIAIVVFVSVAACVGVLCLITYRKLKTHSYLVTQRQPIDPEVSVHN